jgi:Putative zincin peptidase
VFFIPGFLISIATFPGVIVHEAAHMLFCRLRGLAVLDVCFFRVGNPAGYVIHEETDDFNTAFLVSVGPLIVNSILCVVFCFPAFVPVRVFNRPDPVSYVLLWLGISIGMHAFPSTHDAKNVWRLARQQVRTLKPLVLLSFPLVVAIYAANILSVVWFDYFYGFALGILLPEFLFQHLV